MSDWHVNSPFTSADVNALQILEDGSFYAVSADGQLVHAEFDGATAPLARVDAPLFAMEVLTDSEVLCCGKLGTIVFYTPNGTRVQRVADRPRLSGLVATGPEDALIVGAYDEASGVMFRFVRATNALVDVTPVPHPRGLAAIAALAPDAFLLAGQRGYLAVWAGQQEQRIPTGTEHPLRAVCARGSDDWLVGGGGWAQQMPVLMEGNREGMRPLLSAGGDRVIVGIAQDSGGRIWLAESRSDGTNWHGLVWEFRDGRLRPEGEFPAHALRGIACQGDRVAVCGTGGLLAWTRPV